MSIQQAPADIGSQQSTGAQLSLRSLRKSYSGKAAIDDITLDVRPGEFMTLLGPSGSGKTTTLNAIAGFSDLDAGTIHLDGRDISSVPPRLRGIGMVFQNYALFPHLTVAQNIAFPLEQRKLHRNVRREKVERAVETVRLAGLEHRKPAELSGGQQQRVALARAIVFQPSLLLMDEPLGALDRGLRESMQAEIRRIHREVGSTVILVTHDQEEALALSDRIAVFNNGRIQQVGSGEDLYLRPHSLFVAQFLGESTILPDLDDPEGKLAVIRPENAEIASREFGLQRGHAGVEGTVIEDVYLGHERRVTVSLPHGVTGIVRNSERSGRRYEPGSEVSFQWPRDSVVRLPRPQAT